MKLLYSLKDDQYPDNGYTHERSIVRGIVYNDNLEVALIHLYGDDAFGHRDYYETPGGGVKPNESLEDALKRELQEELGAEIDNIQEIGIVIDFYNFIQRKNINHYFLCHVTGFHENDLTEQEKKFFHDILWTDIDNLIKVVENTKRTNISTLVINRELPILKIAKEMLKQK